MHAIINFVGSVITPALSSLAQPLLSEDVWNNLLTEGIMDAGLVAALVAYLVLLLWQNATRVAGIVLFCVFWRRRKLSGGEVLPEGEKPHALALFSPGMIACMAVMLMLLAVNLIPA
jgi:hypothetical protein